MSEYGARGISRIVIAFAAALLMLPLVMVGPQGATAQEAEPDVLVRVSVDDAGDGTGLLTVEVESLLRLASAFELGLDFGPGIRPILTDDQRPDCEFGSPWAGACGPSAATDELLLAVFAVQFDRPLGNEIVARLPVTLTGPAEDQTWTARPPLLWDFDGEPLRGEVVTGQSDAAFVNITPDCDREVLVVTSELPIVASELIDAFGVATDLELVEVEPGLYEAVPSYWDFEFVSVRVLEGGEVFERTQFFNGIACDADFDDVPDPVDNCPGSYNPSQADFDGNGIGDSCDGTVVNCGNGLFRVATSHASTLEALVASSDASICWAVGGGGPNFALSLTLIGLDPQADIDLSPLTALESLDILNSDLTVLPPGLTSLERLAALGLSGNSLDSLPEDLNDLTSLNTLGLADNAFTEVPPAAWTSPTLQRLILSGNQLTTLPGGIGDGLQVLDLRDNALTGDLTSLLDAWFAVDRDFGDAAFLGLDDGPGGNDCITTANPEASVVWGVRRIALECDAEVPVEGQVRAPDGVTGIFGAEVCAERPLLETLCVFTDVFGSYRFDDLGQGNVRFTVTDPAQRYEIAPTDFLGLVTGEDTYTIDFDAFLVGLGGVDPAPEPTPSPTPDPEPGPAPTPAPVPSDALVGTISGRFFDADGAPLIGQQVCVEMVFVGTGGCTSTDGIGHFFFGGLFTGNYVVTGLIDGEAVATYQYAGVGATVGVAGIELRAS